MGSERTVQVNARVISATNRDLEVEIAAGRFRVDLFFRLCVVPISTPPLRDRQTDLPDLAAYFLDRIAAQEGRDVARIDDDAMTRLRTHH